ncbi:outer membrane protein [Legionella fairfieldensis]|uniref:outer membrane protein n=1 Tax=Legionella fairfieldensis TaxID=45064 RepID=UPI00048C83A4|nr:outer membrane beta-barrel protein [Legionella fairfieldensis]
MKYSTKCALTGLLLSSCSVFAATPAEGWYAGLMGGASFSSSLRFQINDPSYVLDAALDNPVIVGQPFFPTFITPGFNPFLSSLLLVPARFKHGIGGDFGGQLGYRICNFRIEGELLFNYAPFSRLNVGGVIIRKHVTPTIPIHLNGHTTVGAGLINAFYDFYDEENDPTWVPYIGLGGGYAVMHNTITLTVPYLFTTAVSQEIRGSKNAPVGQAILGVAYYYSDSLALGLDYRYLTTKSITFNGFSARLEAHSVNFNFNYWFEDV